VGRFAFDRVDSKDLSGVKQYQVDVPLVRDLTPCGDRHEYGGANATLLMRALWAADNALERFLKEERDENSYGR
jgi:hypothetical protein